MGPLPNARPELLTHPGPENISKPTWSDVTISPLSTISGHFLTLSADAGAHGPHKPPPCSPSPDALWAARIPAAATPALTPNFINFRRPIAGAGKLVS